MLSKEFQAVAQGKREQNDALVAYGEDLAIKAGLWLPGETPTYPGQPAVGGNFSV